MKIASQCNRYVGYTWPGLILGLRPANARRCYFVTTSLSDWAQTSIQPCMALHLSTDLLIKSQHFAHFHYQGCEGNISAMTLYKKPLNAEQPTNQYLHVNQIWPILVMTNTWICQGSVLEATSLGDRWKCWCCGCQKCMQPLWIEYIKYNHLFCKHSQWSSDQWSNDLFNNRAMIITCLLREWIYRDVCNIRRTLEGN